MFRLRFRPARRLGNFLVFVGFMLLTGYVILVVTRLFLFPRRVRPMHAILMGLCSWWLLIIPVMLVREQHMSTDLKAWLALFTLGAAALACLTWLASLLEAIKGRR